MDTLINFFAGGPNADTIKSSCQAACTTQQANSYCTEVRTLKTSNTVSYLGSCKTFSGLGVAGIATCPDINCGPETLPKKCKDIDSSASWQKTCSGTATAGATDLTSQVGDSENYNIKDTPYCCKLSVLSCKNRVTNPCNALASNKDACEKAAPVCRYTAENTAKGTPADCGIVIQAVTAPSKSGCEQIDTKDRCELPQYLALCVWN